MPYPANFAVEWVDEVTGNKVTTTFPHDALLVLAGVVAANAPEPVNGPQVVYPGGPAPHASMPDGSILTVGAGGEVYLDAKRMPGIFARQVVQFGRSVYAQGKTNPVWWVWDGALWNRVLDFDATVLTELPSPA